MFKVVLTQRSSLPSRCTAYVATNARQSFHGVIRNQQDEDWTPINIRISKVATVEPQRPPLEKHLVVDTTE